jgi:hypothetical protein
MHCTAEMSEPASSQGSEVEIAPGVTAEDIQPFIYDKIYPFVFCSLCKSGIIVPSARTHLRSMHREAVSEMQRNRAAYTLSLLPNMYQKEAELDEYKGPDSVCKAIPYLEAPRPNMFKCDECGHSCSRRKNMQEHCRKEHGLLSERRVGAPSRANLQQKFSVPWREGVKCQRFSKRRKLSRWFEVCDGESHLVG